MSRFKVGDLVTPVNVDRYTDRNSDRRKEMLGRTLVVRSVHNDEFTSVVFAGFPGEGVWQWRPNDLELVSEPDTDPAPAAVAEVPEPLVWVDGATHYQPHQDAFYKRVSAHEWYVWSRIIEREPLHWCKAPGTSDSAEWVVRNQPTDPAPAAAKKPIRRGDLVMHRGQIGVVHDTDPDGENGYWVAALTGDGSCVWRCTEELTRIGSIRKKIKRLKAAIAKAGGEA